MCTAVIEKISGARMRDAHAGANHRCEVGSNGCPGGRHLQHINPSMRERNVGIQALWDLMTVAKQPGGKAAGTLKPSHISHSTLTFRILVIITETNTNYWCN